jgi:arsenate reductase (glutaredoxin)
VPTVIYHNPKCSKSCATLDLLVARGIAPTVIDYLQTPPDARELARLVALLGGDPRVLLRCNEPEYTAAGLDDPLLSDDVLIEAMVAQPLLIQRPIVLANGKAVIGRPPDAVLAIL